MLWCYSSFQVPKGQFSFSYKLGIIKLIFDIQYVVKKLVSAYIYVQQKFLFLHKS